MITLKKNHHVGSDILLIFYFKYYKYDFNESSSRISTSFDNDLKSSCMYSSRLSYLPLHFTLCSELDPLKGQHKVGTIIQVVNCSKEEAENNNGTM